MAQLSDFISRIFSTDRTQGLSGGAEVVIDQDPASAFYASRLRKHRTDDDFVENPDHLWTTVSFHGRRGGLRAHVTAERGDGVASFTDALLVLNQADARRADGDAWRARAAEGLAEKFRSWCEKDRFELLYGTRPLRVRFVEDGGPEMLGQSFNLGPGEFLTGLLPNLYVGPGPRSRPVLAVHVNLPGVWEGYREVGRLYSDQILFTLGRHWLDNFHHPALREPGLYRLQQYPDGSLVHVISPELQDRYLVRSDQLDSGASVLTVAERNGPAVAYLVLAVVEMTTTMDGFLADVVAAAAPAPAPAQAPPAEPAHADAGRIDAVAMQAPRAEPTRDDNAARERRDLLQRTIVPDADRARILTLQERGALLQRVHFAAFMEGYDVFVGGGGRVATQMSEPRATLQVRGPRVSLVVHDPGVKVGGEPAVVGRPVPLTGQVDIEVDGHVFQYRDISGTAAEGWPYLGELRRPGAGTYLDFGGSFRVGRDRRCKVRLPDEPHNENIAWLPQVGGGATIRSRTGDIPKSRFYTDSIMVASEHAEIDLADEPVLRSLARHCYTYVRRGDQLLTLAPREGAHGATEVPLMAGDEVLVGNCLFQVSYPPPGGEEEAPEPVADVGVQAEAGEGAAAPPSREKLPVREKPPEPPGWLPPPAHLDDVPLPANVNPGNRVETPTEAPAPLPFMGTRTVEVPAAFGLGERGPAPRAPRLIDPPPSKPPPPMMLEEPFVEPPPALPAVPLLQEEDARDADPVRAVEEAQWKLELTRPGRLVQVGWMVSGEVIVGNHDGAQVIVPEVRAFPEQAFMTLDYFRLYVRGKKGTAALLQEGEARIVQGGREHAAIDELDGAVLEVVRRDANLEPDFDVMLRVQRDASLPDPRARLLTVDTSDRLVRALFTLGFPMRADRRLRIGPVRATFRFDGALLRITDYLESYRAADGFLPFFVREGDRPWQTFPEDGARVELNPGDQVIAGNVVWRFEA